MKNQAQYMSLIKKQLPDGVYRTDKGYGCRHCLVSCGLNTKQAINHDCKKTRKRWSEMHKTLQSPVGGYRRQAGRRFV